MSAPASPAGGRSVMPLERHRAAEHRAARRHCAGACAPSLLSIGSDAAPKSIPYSWPPRHCSRPDTGAVAEKRGSPVRPSKRNRPFASTMSTSCRLSLADLQARVLHARHRRPPRRTTSGRPARRRRASRTGSAGRWAPDRAVQMHVQRLQAGVGAETGTPAGRQRLAIAPPDDGHCQPRAPVQHGVDAQADGDVRQGDIGIADQEFAAQQRPIQRIGSASRRLAIRRCETSTEAARRRWSRRACRTRRSTTASGPVTSQRPGPWVRAHATTRRASRLSIARPASPAPSKACAQASGTRVRSTSVSSGVRGASRSIPEAWPPLA